MSQYFHIANNTKKQYLSDHDMKPAGGGIDFSSICGARFGSLQLLALLLSSDVSYGDRVSPPFCGEWQGDSIGMYGDWGSETEYEKISSEYTNVTPQLMAALMAIPYWNKYILEVTK